MKEKNREKLFQIFEIVFEINSKDQITKQKRLANSEWDSLRHVSLITAIESEFDIKFSIEEMDAISSYRYCELLLDKKGL